MRRCYSTTTQNNNKFEIIVEERVVMASGKGILTGLNASHSIYIAENKYSKGEKLFRFWNRTWGYVIPIVLTLETKMKALRIPSSIIMRGKKKKKKAHYRRLRQISFL
jgi:hypothetical protein